MKIHRSRTTSSILSWPWHCHMIIMSYGHRRTLSWHCLDCQTLSWHYLGYCRSGYFGIFFVCFRCFGRFHFGFCRFRHWVRGPLLSSTVSLEGMPPKAPVPLSKACQISRFGVKSILSIITSMFYYFISFSFIFLFCCIRNRTSTKDCSTSDMWNCSTLESLEIISAWSAQVKQQQYRQYHRRLQMLIQIEYTSKAAELMSVNDWPSVFAKWTRPKSAEAVGKEVNEIN